MLMSAAALDSFSSVSPSRSVAGEGWKMTFLLFALFAWGTLIKRRGKEIQQPDKPNQMNLEKDLPQGSDE